MEEDAEHQPLENQPRGQAVDAERDLAGVAAGHPDAMS
jgi:hypothetical protein